MKPNKAFVNNEGHIVVPIPEGFITGLITDSGKSISYRERNESGVYSPYKFIRLPHPTKFAGSFVSPKCLKQMNIEGVERKVYILTC